MKPTPVCQKHMQKKHSLRRGTLGIFIGIFTAFLVLAGCTSFSFGNRKKGSAPAELQDRKQMVSIAAGSFEMGALQGEPDEYPPHMVEVDAFLLDRTEVTVGAYKNCVRARICPLVSVTSSSEEKDSTSVTDAHPVVGVNWANAQAYCEWVGKRLPTEAEWERAARAAHHSPYPWGGGFEVSYVNGRGTEDGYARTAPVGSFPSGASLSGVWDLAGNAAEWTADWYEATYYQKSPAKNPKGPKEPTGSKVVRGGSFTDNDYLLRAVARMGLDPNVSNDAVGFRCAADAG